MRFVDGKVELCEVVSQDEQGVVLRLDRVPRPVRFSWWQIDPDDAEALKTGDRGGPAEAVSAERTIAGIRVRTTDGKVHEGLPLSGAPPGEIWLKNAGGKVVVRAGEVASREEARVPLQRVFTPDELFTHLVSRIRPSTPEDFDRLGAELVRVRLADRAGSVLRVAELLRHPDRPESRLYRDLGKLRDLLEDIAVRQAAFDARESCLAGDYERALERLDAVEQGLPASAPAAAGAEVRRLRGLVQELRGAAREERIVQEWYRTFDALIKAKAMDREISHAEAKAWVEGTLPGEVERHVQARFNFSPGDPEARRAWDRRPGSASFKHSAGNGSWLELRPEARAPEAWWSAADDASRYAVLKGLAVERHLHVLARELKGCPSCGGTGVDAAARPAGQACPSCLGTKAQRILFYR